MILVKKFGVVALIIAFFAIGAMRHATVTADSQKAYQDYLFQADLYRKTLSEFTIAKNEYEKFKSLASETLALDKTKRMLAQRDRLLRSYLLLLTEKLIENPGLVSSTRNLYISLVGNELAFLERHSELVPSINSLGDAQTVSQQLESHDNILQVSIEQTITALILGNLNSLAVSYDQVVTQAQNLMSIKRDSLPPTKRETVDRWLLQIQSKRSLYQQKVDTIAKKNTALTGADSYELDRQSVEIQQEALGAKQYLSEGASYLGELVTAFKYED